LLEVVVAEKRGKLGIWEAAVIQTIIRWESHAALCARWLRRASELGETLTHADKLAYSREVARASSERDKCLRALGLNQGESADLYATLYVHPPIAPLAAADSDQAPNPSPPASDAPAATPSDQEANP
jgi:hypothetical protein